MQRCIPGRDTRNAGLDPSERRSALKQLIVFSILLICLGMSACGPVKAGAASKPEPTTTPEVFMPLPADQRAFEAVRSTLAQQLSVDPLSITLVTAEPVDWPDSCLGLPADQEMCAQMITPGFRFTVKQGDKVYEFHTDQGATNIREKK